METRRVRTAIVALPIAIVTSWVLYNRLVKGDERKRFPLSASQSQGQATN